MTQWGLLVMLSSTLLPGHALALTQPFGFILWSHPLLGNFWDEAVPELSKGEQIRPPCTWNRETIRWSNSETIGRAGGTVPACPSFLAPMWDVWSFKAVLIPFHALTCPRINLSCLYWGKTDRKSTAMERAQTGVPEAGHREGFSGFAKAARDALI